MNSESNRHIPAFEATSLTNKFKQLWLTGTEARLVFETRDGKAWGTLHVCLGEHPHDANQLPPHPQEHHKGRDTPSKRRRRERREAARSAAVKAAPLISEEGAAEATNDARVIAEEVVTLTLNSETEQSVANEVTEEVIISDTVQKQPLYVTEIDDEICSDEEYYDEIDAKSAFTCLQCKIEYFPENFVEGEKVLFYGLCRWHLGVWKCRNCSINLVGLGKIRAHRQICRAPS